MLLSTNTGSIKPMRKLFVIESIAVFIAGPIKIKLN